MDFVKMPPLIGPLADLPDHVKQVVEAYGRACVREAIAAALRAAPEGYVLVPVEPTDEMIEASLIRVPIAKRINPGQHLRIYGARAWYAMLAARPQGVR